MRKINFTIRGNAINPLGNAMPKVKLTKAQQWTERAQDYVAWKDHVVKAVMGSLDDPLDVAVSAKNLVMLRKPLTINPGQFGFMRLRIAWMNEAHADAESVFGSIADALFVNDKHLDGLFLSDHDQQKIGTVQVDLWIFETIEEKRQFINNL